MNPWLGTPSWKKNEGRVILYYRFNSESFPITSMRLKVEINTREHFTTLGLFQKSFEIKNSWYSKETIVITYILEELLGTKLRALYQRKKGRDLFDLSIALKPFPSLNIPNMLACFNYYMLSTSTPVSRAQYEKNLSEKLKDIAFREDIIPLLSNVAKDTYNPIEEALKLHQKVIKYLPGEPWGSDNIFM